ncbi:MAG: Ig-like domain-containing protein [Pyrinomonadaceae bacterium]
MRLARRALVAALTLLVLCAAVSAQTLRSEGDPRNTSPTVGTGGPMGGPTGLFTIYDGQTLRRGEYTFSIAYSNYDRDPGDVDITEIPTSFQIGLNDHFELFFNTDAYRGVKVNSPQNLSGFYLPNSQLYYGAGIATLRNPAAIILAPRGPGAGTIGLTAIFRPTGNQPFAQFPYTGASAGNFGFQGLTNAQIGAFFGFPGLPTLGPPISAGGGGNYGRADLFPGVGSAYGGILPGIVFSQAIRFCGAAAPVPCNRVPISFTVAPVYLPDAPFINRLYGQSAFSTFTVGAKWRFNSVKDSWGWGIIPFYRFYADKADDAGGFNQMQRGASPGGSIGDFGLVLFADARLSRSVNVSGNFGYILNSNPKGDFPNGTFTLLDRPDEVIAGVGFDFPVNNWFQPMIEVRSTQYVGGRTPNSFQNNPLDVIAGFKIYPKRWYGFGAAWRYHVNQQDKQSFSNNGARNVTLAAVGTTLATTAAVVQDGVPAGFRPSDDANGFIFQFWVGRRNERVPDVLPNRAPTVSLGTSSGTVTLPCPPEQIQGASCPVSQSVQLTANASDPDGDTLLYTYSATGGRIVGDGANVTWDLSGAQPGTYTTTVEVNDGCGCISFDSKTVEVTNCRDCTPKSVCPVVTVSCPTDVIQSGQAATVSGNISGGDPNASYTYNWTVSSGSISGGQGTSTITVDTTNVDGSVTATLEIGGAGPECNRTASCTFSVAPILQPRKFDEYGRIKRNDEKARLDNYAIELQNNPSAQGYIITYGGRVGPAGEAQTRADFAKNYLVSVRGIDSGRLVTVDGGYKETGWTELWIVPSGATPPSASPTVDASEVKTTGGRRRRGGH